MLGKLIIMCFSADAEEVLAPVALECQLPWKRDSCGPIRSMASHQLPDDDRPNLATVPSWADNLDYNHLADLDNDEEITDAAADTAAEPKKTGFSLGVSSDSDDEEEGKTPTAENSPTLDKFFIGGSHSPQLSPQGRNITDSPQISPQARYTENPKMEAEQKSREGALSPRPSMLNGSPVPDRKSRASRHTANFSLGDDDESQEEQEATPQNGGVGFNLGSSSGEESDDESEHANTEDVTIDIPPSDGDSEDDEEVEIKPFGRLRLNESSAKLKIDGHVIRSNGSEVTQAAVKFGLDDDDDESSSAYEV